MTNIEPWMMTVKFFHYLMMFDRIISETLVNSGSRITPKHVYTILKNDRSGMYSAVLKAFGINKKTIYNNDSKDSIFNVINNISTSETSKNFKIIISEEKWAQIKSTRQTYGRGGICRYKQANGHMSLLTKYRSKQNYCTHLHLNALKSMSIVMLSVMHNSKVCAMNVARI